MALFARLLLLTAIGWGCAVLAQEPRERIIESVLPSLDYGPECWSSVDLRNLGDRVVAVDVEAHRASGALVPLNGLAPGTVRLHPGEHASYRLEIAEETGAAWMKIRERIPSARMTPVIAVAGASECIAGNQLRTTSREVAFPLRNPWFSDGVDAIHGNIVSVVNTSEQAARISLCYSSGNLYSLPSKAQPIADLRPICSSSTDVQIPPFGARQFPVERDGSTHFSLKSKGDSVVLQMLRPLDTGVKVYSVDSTIRFEGEAAR